MSPHEEFLELGAASIAGELNEEERRKLDEHLSGCAGCREALKKFQETIKVAIPAIAGGLVHENPFPEESWSQETAKAALLDRLSHEGRAGGSGAIEKDVVAGFDPSAHRAYVPSRFRWGQLWMTYAAVVLLFLALAVSAYRVGIHRRVAGTTNTPASPGKGTDGIESQLSEVRRDRDTLRSELDERDKAIADLKQQVERLKATDSEHAEQSVASQNEQEKRLAEEEASTTVRLADLQKKLDAAEKARSEDSARAAGLEAKLADLTQQLHETVTAEDRQLQSREGTIEQQQTQLAEQKELLDHDRDIRELMGARELYVAEVFDIGKDAATQKSYGRIFFTKGKSLIFYAYDLDRQPGVKNASTFQVWGQRGIDREQALNLGIFFEDNVSKKRWILKFDDPQKLAQIDAVFVTVEPNGGSRKPSGKPFLFAYLKVNPNHP
ncbi:MAG: zf-HC2 domain-containing protein [Candidatus Acidiferrum sp.]